VVVLVVVVVVVVVLVEVVLVVPVAVVVVVVLEVVVVVVAGGGHVPSVGGFRTLNCFAPSFVTRPSAPKRTWYASPPPISSRTQPSVPRSGGTTSRAPSLPAATAL